MWSIREGRNSSAANGVGNVITPSGKALVGTSSAAPGVVVPGRR